MHLTPRFMIFILVTLLGANVGLAAWGERINDRQTVSLAEKDAAIAKTNEQNTTLEGKKQENLATLVQKETEVTAKTAELEKLNAELTAKLKQLDEANKKVAGLESSISATSAQIAKLREIKPLFTFTVESTSISNVESKKAQVRDVVTAAYDEMVSVYSKPYLLHEVIISFVDSFIIPGAYAEIKLSNSSEGLTINIRIKDFDKNNFLDVNAIIHEIIHSFHGLAVLEPAAYEEGITVAATEAVMTNLIAKGKIPAFSPLYIRTSVNDYLNSSVTIPSDNSFYTDSNAGTYYQLAGVGWYEIYKADNGFFRKFNEKLYEKTRNGDNVTSATVKQLILQNGPSTVQGKSLGEWLETKAFKLK